MKIKVFINRKYLAKRYEMSEETIERFNLQVLPNLMNRLSMDSRVDLIEIFTSESSHSNIGFGSKIQLNQVDTDDAQSYAELFDLCSISQKNKDEIIIVYNPLFPFLSLDKIYAAYNEIANGKFESAFGVDNYYSNMINGENAEIMDAGIFSIFKFENFKKSRRRIKQPVLAVKLSAIELISLREKEDYELYGLVVNSGLMQ